MLYLTCALRYPLSNAVPKIHGKLEYRDARKCGWDDLCALAAKSCTRWNMKIGDGKKLKSKLVAIMNPHGDRVRAIVKNKTCAFLKARKKQMKEAKKVTRLQKELEVRGTHAKVLTQHQEEKQGKLQEKATAKEGKSDGRKDSSDP